MRDPLGMQERILGPLGKGDAYEISQSTAGVVHSLELNTGCTGLGAPGARRRRAHCAVPHYDSPMMVPDAVSTSMW